MKLIERIQLLFHRKQCQRINLEFPTAWEEMDEKDFEEVCKLLVTPRPREETLFLAFCKLAHIRPDNPKIYPNIPKGLAPYIVNGQAHFIGHSVIAEGCRQISFILDGTGFPPAPFPHVDRKLYGLSFEKFYEADSLTMRSVVENDEGYLKEAAKILTGGAKRKLVPWERKALLIWWNGLKMYLKEQYPHVFQDGENITDKTQGQILLDLLSTMNDQKPQENERILKTDVHAVLHELNLIYYNAKQRLSAKDAGRGTR